MTNMQNHLDPNDIAALADGREIPGTDVLQRHLAGCRSCLAAYAEAVRVAHLRAQRPDAFAVPPDLLAAALAAGRRPRRFVAAPPRRWRPGLAAATATAVLVLAVALAPGPHPGRLAPGDNAALGTLLWAQSAAGPLLPGAVASTAGAAPVYRSGSALVPTLDRALHEAATTRGRAPRDPQQAYWLGAGYLATGQLGTAVDLIRVARQAYPQDQALLVLDGVAAYRASDLARAEELLREAWRRDPGDTLARFDLAVVLADAGRSWEAQQVLAAGAWPVGTEIARRATAMADSLP